MASVIVIDGERVAAWALLMLPHSELARSLYGGQVRLGVFM
jgi:hypothetical protein